MEEIIFILNLLGYKELADDRIECGKFTYISINADEKRYYLSSTEFYHNLIVIKDNINRNKHVNSSNMDSLVCQFKENMKYL